MESAAVQDQTALDAALDAAATIVVAGRTFHACRDTTYEQDIYIMGLQKRAGIDGLSAEFEREQTLSELTERIILTAFDTGQLFDLLGASFEEEGIPWTISEARANGRFFAQLRDRRDKETLRSSIVAVLLSFFVKGLLSSAISRSSSTSASQQPNQQPSRTNARFDANGVVVEPKRNLNDSRIGRDTAAGSNSGSGMTLSENSPDTTPADTPPS